MKLEGKHVIVVGLARQGKAAARWLVESAGARVTVTDGKDAASLAEPLAALEGLPLDYALGGHPESLLDDADLLCLSAGVPTDSPFVRAARAQGVPLTNDAQLFIERCPARVIGVTGSAGKTTTVSLVGAMCRATGTPTWVGGNIGHVLIGELAQIDLGDWVVMELSSFQLEIMTASPGVAAVLNITPNHLDRHRAMSAYVMAKARILHHQAPTDVAVLGRDDPGALQLTREVQSELWWFSAQAPTALGAYLDEDEILLARPGAEPEHICGRDEILLRGDHNVLNVLAAAAIAGAAGVPLDAMQAGVAGFTGVPHRLEPVAMVDDVLWVNDSIATAPERTIAALQSYEEPVVLLAGGRDKDLPWDEFAEAALGRVREMVCFGEAGPMVANQVMQVWTGGNRQEEALLQSVTVVEDLMAAVMRATEVAQPGEVVLLSPGGTSFDAYDDFEARGVHFRALVRGLAEGG